VIPGLNEALLGIITTPVDEKPAEEPAKQSFHKKGQSSSFSAVSRFNKVLVDKYLGQDLTIPSQHIYSPQTEYLKTQVTRQIVFPPYSPQSKIVCIEPR
jgi:hypothetical protein